MLRFHFIVKLALLKPFLCSPSSVCMGLRLGGVCSIHQIVVAAVFFGSSRLKQTLMANKEQQTEYKEKL